MNSEERDDIRPHETDLIGQWLDTGNRVEGDAVCARIQWLITERLEPLATSPTGPESWFRDRRDGRLWELTYPWGHLPGGGPPRLTRITPEVARARYGIARPENSC